MPKPETSKGEWPKEIDICQECGVRGAPCGGRHIVAQRVSVVPASSVRELVEAGEDIQKADAVRCAVVSNPHASDDDLAAAENNYMQALANHKAALTQANELLEGDEQ